MSACSSTFLPSADGWWDPSGALASRPSWFDSLGRQVVNKSIGRESAPLKTAERLSAGSLGLLLVGLAFVLVIHPPGKRVALAQCTDATAGCIVTVDSDLTSFAAILAGIGAAAILIACLLYTSDAADE